MLPMPFVLFLLSSLDGLGSCTQTSVKATVGGYGVSRVSRSMRCKGGNPPKTYL